MFLVVAVALTQTEINFDWGWILDHLCGTLSGFDKEVDVTEFVICKVESMLATIPTTEGEMYFINSISYFQNFSGMSFERKFF